MSHGFLHSWQLAITPLAPVHVGTGEDYEPTQYVIDGEGLFSFSPEAAVRALPMAAREDLLRILGGRPDVALIKSVQGYFYRHRERLIPEAEHVIPVLASIAAEYANRVGQTAQREQSGREIINQLRIARTYTDPATWRPILPGSSLKGAMRTALLDLVNGGASLPRDIKELPPTKRNQALQNRLFRYRPGRFEQDPMRLVQIGDASDRRPSDTLGTEIRYAVNRKRHPVTKDGREIAAQAENLRQVLECVPPLRPRAFGGRLALNDLGSLTGPKLPDPELRWTFDDIAAACNTFYRPILQQEVTELRSRGYLDTHWQQAVSEILDTQREALDAGRAFLLRVGQHSGAESVTLNGVRDIKINMGRDPRTGKPRFDYLPETKTVWLAAQDIQARRNLLPFGWLLVESVPEGGALPPWPDALIQATAAYRHDEPQWIREIQGRRKELQTQLAKQRAHDEAQRAAEKKAQLEAEARAAKLAKLSAEARQIEALRELLARDRAANRKEKGGELANRLVELLKEAESNWQGQDCIDLADLAHEIYGFIGWPASKKKQERRDQIDRIRSKSD